ncbi:MAG: cryptochrome/photolyase family protein [Bacteroidetes bacterium]|nr:cryptochrome/photolyase family protein [Bacteroidota bacterium]
MSQVLLIFPHQLFKAHPLLNQEGPFYLIEEHLFFKQYAFHKQKLQFHRASMKAYEQYLINQGKDVRYIPSSDERSDIRHLIPSLSSEGFSRIAYVDPTDYLLERRLKRSTVTSGIRSFCHDSPLFLNKKSELSRFFRADKKKFFQTEFYIQQRKSRGILLDGSGGALGGKWSFDSENRQRYPKGATPPDLHFPIVDERQREATKYVQEHFEEHPGLLEQINLYPTDFQQAEAWLEDFLIHRFNDFGAYEDAIVADEVYLNHSILSPLMNVGLLTPQQVIDRAIDHAQKYDVPLNSLEGFVRQIIGWREFIRGMYECKGVEARTKNYWGFDREIPKSFYDGTTGILPVDIVIKKVIRTGYCHHIERLMVLGNFMLLCEFDPDEVYRWFMEYFIDAYDWVMVPNVYGMSQFADGGLLATKPYISGSNYLRKMADFPKGDWQDTWDALFWRFMHVHRDFFTGNPRLGMLVGSFDRMPEEKRNQHLKRAEAYLNTLQ